MIETFDRYKGEATVRRRHEIEPRGKLKALDEVEGHLRAWRPAMGLYHMDASISSGFLSAVIHDGLSTALHRRSRPFQELTEEPQLARGAALHAWLSKDSDTRVLRAPIGLKVRRGERWDAERLKAIREGASVLLKAEDYDTCMCAWYSLTAPLTAWGIYDTSAKAEIRAIYKRWGGVPEVSHRWQPPEVPGCWCRIRQDVVAQPPSAEWWGTFSIKTTSKALTDSSWWPFWRRYYMKAEAFYRAGLKNLFGETPFRQFLILARLEPPYPWRIIDLADMAEELDDLWYSKLVPQLAEVTQALARGDRHGPEERGLF